MRFSTGVAIYGDFMDFETLYEQLHEIVGDEEDFPAYYDARIRVLGVCYDLRHALMGDREIGLSGVSSSIIYKRPPEAFRNYVNS